MPIYEFECQEHGVFEATKSLAQARHPARCPACGRAAPRILSLPSLARLSRTVVKAHERNEKSRHQPKVVTRQGGPPAPKPARAAATRPWMIGHSR